MGVHLIIVSPTRQIAFLPMTVEVAFPEKPRRGRRDCIMDTSVRLRFHALWLRVGGKKSSASEVSAEKRSGKNNRSDAW